MRSKNSNSADALVAAFTGDGEGKEFNFMKTIIIRVEESHSDFLKNCETVKSDPGKMSPEKTNSPKNSFR
jgi:hypothetical protein